MEHISMDGSDPPNLSSDDWLFVCKTPANGDEFYNEKLQQVAVRYRHCIKLYADLIDCPASRRPFPIDFAKCFYFPVS